MYSLAERVVMCLRLFPAMIIQQSILMPPKFSLKRQQASFIFEENLLLEFDW